MKNTTHFLSIGLIALSAFFISDKIINNLSISETQTIFNNTQRFEQLPVDVKAQRENYIQSRAEMYATQAEAWHANVQLGLFTSNVLKLLSPIESLKTNTKAYYLYIAFHEFSHAQLNYLIVNGKPVFKLHTSSLSAKEEEQVNERMNNLYRYLGQNHTLVAHFHENFADVYGAILLLRNSTYSVEQVQQAIKTRYYQTQHQREYFFGALGDVEHRTDKSLNILLHQNLAQIKMMSHEQALNLALEIASEGVIKVIPQAYGTLFESKQFKTYISESTVSKLMAYTQAPLNLSDEKTTITQESANLTNQYKKSHKTG